MTLPVYESGNIFFCAQMEGPLLDILQHEATEDNQHLTNWQTRRTTFYKYFLPRPVDQALLPALENVAYTVPELRPEKPAQFIPALPGPTCSSINQHHP